jgi:hypothetical protein
VSNTYQALIFLAGLVGVACCSILDLLDQAITGKVRPDDLMEKPSLRGCPHEFSIGSGIYGGIAIYFASLEGYIKGF